MEDDGNLVEVNIRGIKFLIRRASLTRAPRSLLARDCLDPRESTRSYYNRNPNLFQSIADYYETGRLHFPAGYCLSTVRDELVFWHLDIGLLEPCCWTRLREEIEREETLEKLKIEWASYYEQVKAGSVLAGKFRDSFRNQDPVGKPTTNDNCVDEATNLQQKKAKDSTGYSKRDALWNFLDSPRSSKAARIWAVAVMLIVVLSVLNLMLQSVIKLRDVPLDVAEFAANNLTERKLLYILSNSRPHQALRVIDVVCCIVLSLELFLRFATCRKKCKFLVDFYTVTDLIGIIPMWVLLLMGLFRGHHAKRHHAELVIEGLRLFRIFRMSRLVKHVPTLKLLAMALKRSYKELFLLLLLMNLAGTLFAFLIFYGELSEDNYWSIPQGLWWALITMTTVGYGDVHPVGVVGCVIGATCAVTGILVIAMPVPIIVNNFSEIYRASKTFQRLRKKPGVFSELEGNAHTEDMSKPQTEVCVDTDAVPTDQETPC